MVGQWFRYSIFGCVCISFLSSCFLGRSDIRFNTLSFVLWLRIFTAGEKWLHFHCGSANLSPARLVRLHALTEGFRLACSAEGGRQYEIRDGQEVTPGFFREFSRDLFQRSHVKLPGWFWVCVCQLSAPSLRGKCCFFTKIPWSVWIQG